MRNFYFFILAFLSLSIWAQAPTLVQDINTTGNSSPNNLYAFGGKIYFGADDSSGVNTMGTDIGRELWTTDGTAAGTNSIIDINPGSSNGVPSSFFELNGVLYFSANPGGGSRVHQTDGTTAGTFALAQSTFTIFNPLVIGTKAYMVGTAGTAVNNSFFEFDGLGFLSVTDLGTGVATLPGGNFIDLNANTILMYATYSTDDATTGIELYSYDIAAMTYTLVKDINPGAGDASISNMTKLGTEVYFEALNKLWKSDGTSAGTMEVAVANSLSSVRELAVFNGNLYFEGDDGSTGDQLYQYDPVADTVTNLSMITGTSPNHDPSDYVEYSGWLYYAAEDGNDSDQHLFRTDGVVVEQLDNTIKDVDEITVLNSKLYFEGEAITGSVGNELYEFDPLLGTINNLINANKIDVYPTLVTDYIQVRGVEEGIFSIYNANAQLVAKGNFTEEERIPLQLKTGVYFMQIQTEQGGITSQRLVVK